jgi:hypothetical protein
MGKPYCESSVTNHTACKYFIQTFCVQQNVQVVEPIEMFRLNR